MKLLVSRERCSGRLKLASSISSKNLVNPEETKSLRSLGVCLILSVCLAHLFITKLVWWTVPKLKGLSRYPYLPRSRSSMVIILVGVVERR